MPLDRGIVLPGVTRKSLMELGESWGEFKVVERVITMADVIKALNENRVSPAFLILLELIFLHYKFVGI